MKSDHHNQIHSITIELQAVIEVQKHVLHDKKMHRHELVTKSNTKLKSVKAKLEEKIVAMRDWVEEMGEEARDATHKTNKAVKAEEKSRNLASMRLTKLIQLKHDLGDAHDSLADESKQCAALEEMSTVRLEIKHERLCGCRGGAGKWSAGVVLLICELLVNGTTPSVVPAILQSTSAHMIGSEVEELPSVNFV